MSDSLLAADEPAPVTVHNENGLPPFLIVVDHAGNSIPRALRGLGVSEAERQRHIAWDIGIAAASRQLADALDATLIQQNYSRLVIDSNRPPGAETSMPEISEATPVPGNIGLNEGGKAARVREIFRPYHDRWRAADPWRTAQARNRYRTDERGQVYGQAKRPAISRVEDVPS